MYSLLKKYQSITSFCELKAQNAISFGTHGWNFKSILNYLYDCESFSIFSTQKP